MPRALRASVVEPVGGHGGMDYYDFGLCDGLAAAGVDVVLHTCAETRIPEDADFAVRHAYRGIYGRRPAWIRGLRHLAGTLRALSASLREGRRVCHFHFFHVGSLHFASIVLARLLARRVVITAHDVESFVQALEVPLLSRCTYALAHRVIAHNQASRDELVSRLRVASARIRIVPHGNYLHVIGPLPPQDAARRSLGLPADAQVVLFFGQIKQVKGLDTLVRAVAQLAAARPQLRLLVAGRPWKTGFEPYRRLMRELDVESRCVTHIRFIDEHEVSAYYAAADLVALPYRRIYQSGVLLLTMSHARTAIVSDLPGMTDIVRDRVNGLVFRAGDAQALAACIDWGLEHPTDAEAIGRAAREHVRVAHDWHRIGRDVRAVYEEVLA